LSKLFLAPHRPQHSWLIILLTTGRR
jgi:hypothetical protein